MKDKLLAILALFIVLGSGVRAAEWGAVRMRFTFDGEPPKPQFLSANKDKDVCGTSVPDESLLVNSQDRGIANVVCMMSSPPDDVHPDVLTSAHDEVKISVKLCRFQPHVVVLGLSNRLVISNEDPIGHSAHVPSLEISPLISSGKDYRPIIQNPGPGPGSVVCNIHPWMVGWIVVTKNPYAALSDEHGVLTLNNLPTGKWQFRLWHERSGWLTSAIREKRIERWEKGYVTIDVQPQVNDLGEIKLSPEIFKR